MNKSGRLRARALNSILAQLLGALGATALFRWLVPLLSSEAKEVVFTHTDADCE
jgi:hypothetical protein